MKVIQDTTQIPPELMTELQDAAAKLARGERDIDAAKQAAQLMDQLREQNRRLLGVQNLGVDLIRQLRDSR